MKRILFLCTLVAAPFSLVADVFYINVDKTKKYQKCLCSDWDECIASDMGNFSKKMNAFFVAPGLWGASKGMKDARHEGQPLEGLAAHLDYMIAQKPSLQHKRAKLMHKLNEAKPHVPIIDYYQKLQADGVPLIIATNNDHETLVIKTTKVNKHLQKKQHVPLTYAACYCAGSCPLIKDGKTSDGMPAGSVWAGKNSDEYFEKLFRFAESEFGYDRANTLFIFVDDLKHNIERACTVAKREGVALLAIHKNKSDNKIVREMHAALSSLALHASLAPLKKAGQTIIEESRKSIQS